MKGLVDITTESQDELDILHAELAARELARRDYSAYLTYTYPDWIETRMASYLAGEVQNFIETVPCPNFQREVLVRR